MNADAPQCYICGTTRQVKEIVLSPDRRAFACPDDDTLLMRALVNDWLDDTFGPPGTDPCSAAPTAP